MVPARVASEAEPREDHDSPKYLTSCQEACVDRMQTAGIEERCRMPLRCGRIAAMDSGLAEQLQATEGQCDQWNTSLERVEVEDHWAPVLRHDQVVRMKVDVHDTGRELQRLQSYERIFDVCPDGGPVSGQQPSRLVPEDRRPK